MGECCVWVLIESCALTLDTRHMPHARRAHTHLHTTSQEVKGMLSTLKASQRTELLLTLERGVATDLFGDKSRLTQVRLCAAAVELKG